MREGPIRFNAGPLPQEETGRPGDKEAPDHDDLVLQEKEKTRRHISKI